MEIIFITSALKGGGAERVMATLANRFAKKEDDVTILMVAGDACEYSLDHAVKVCTIGHASGGNPLKQLKRIASMRSYIKAHPNATLISFSTTINMFSILASLGLKNRLILSERNDPNRCSFKGLRNFLYGLKGEFVFQTADAAACFSEKIQQKSIVIPNPLRDDLPAPLANYSLAAQPKQIAAVGRLEAQKNHALLLNAFAGFHTVFPDYTLHLYGRGSLEEALRQQAKELGIEENVIFEGFHTDILEQLTKKAMYVLSSDYEGISNSLMEAMAMGLPCISTDCPIGGSKLVIRDGENGLLVPMHDAVCLQKAMEQIAKDAAFAGKLSANAIKLREEFGEEIITERWHEFAAR